MTAQQQGGHAARFGSELEPAGRGHPGAGNLADHGRQPAMAQRFFHRREHIGIAACFDADQPVGMKTELGDAGGMKLALTPGP